MATDARGKAGFNALFIPGPTNIPTAVRQAMAVPQEDMRASDFPEFVLPLLDDLKRVFKTETGRVFVFPWGRPSHHCSIASGVKLSVMRCILSAGWLLAGLRNPLERWTPLDAAEARRCVC